MSSAQCRGVQGSAGRCRAGRTHAKTILSTHPDSTIRELKWTQSDVVTWFKEAKIKKRSKKVVSCNVQFLPLSLYKKPMEKRLEVFEIPRKDARKFWQPDRVPKRNRHR